MVFRSLRLASVFGGAVLCAVQAAGCADPSPVGAYASAAIVTSRLDLNDVSILFPMPEANADFDAMLGLADGGARGPLLTARAFGDVLRLAKGAPFSQAPMTAALDYTRWRIASVRIDPCGLPDFRAADQSTCKFEVRLVAQPLPADGEGGFENPDFAAR